MTTKELTAVPTLAARGITVGPIAAIDVEAYAGQVTLVAVEGGQRADFLSLMLSGRMAPKAGVVELDGREDPKGLRNRVAIVDAPDTSAPADELPLAEVVMEELVFAGLRAPRRAMRKLLADEGLSDLASTTMGHLPAEVRTRVLTRTAAARKDVDILIIAIPDRHGGDIAAWSDTAHAWAARGYTVIVLASAAAIDAARR
ncbi:hypothetical protein GCM10010922_14360 [Microbacterium sorbitolivorans]|uniref:hypothetical protein n=1 Tax=Microbacterium sorbitolivorans TaxID=1867410 RepID=UPI0013B062F7|nr:hypothetical protein [Microbacterium sorbitolivorans]GGF40167.1 hypothetical protein GCM10010922_14360 [Microbacterium sorbitolivorans]